MREREKEKRSLRLSLSLPLSLSRLALTSGKVIGAPYPAGNLPLLLSSNLPVTSRIERAPRGRARRDTHARGISRARVCRLFGIVFPGMVLHAKRRLLAFLDVRVCESGGGTRVEVEWEGSWAGRRKMRGRGSAGVDVE